MDSATKKLCLDLEKHLQKHKIPLFKKQHRDGKKKAKFSLRGSFKVGNGSCNPGHMKYVNKKPYFKKHTFKKVGVFTKPPDVQLAHKKITQIKYIAYKLAREIIQKVDPDYAQGEYEVNFSCMDRPTHYVKRHVDDQDISHQYALGLGEYKGAELRVWNKTQSNFQDFDYRHKMLQMDGRNYHELVSNKFEGERFTVIWYKTYDHRKTQADPILDTPEVVWSF